MKLGPGGLLAPRHHGRQVVVPAPPTPEGTALAAIKSPGPNLCSNLELSSSEPQPVSARWQEVGWNSLPCPGLSRNQSAARGQLFEAKPAVSGIQMRCGDTSCSDVTA